ncbi:MAG: hypothetical protein MZV63_46870 [Marinilabiliales bacterium]|nr:hypothetical protein [Marinilabiliales bacterium]
MRQQGRQLPPERRSDRPKASFPQPSIERLARDRRVDEGQRRGDPRHDRQPV